MAKAEESKRIKIMLLFVIILVLIVVLQGNKKRQSSSSSASLASRIIGVNLTQDLESFKDAELSRDLAQIEKSQFENLENKLIEDREVFWSYNKAGTPKGIAQQEILRIAKDMGITGFHIDYGSERTLSGSQYFKTIDYNISSRTFELKNLANFMDRIDKNLKKFHWKDMRIYNSTRGLSFSGSIRIYVLNKKATTLLDGKSR
jgi:hypothetical protein